MRRTVGFLMTGFILCSLLTMWVTGCVDNEQSFYIEHVKALPDPPDCTVSAGDAEATVYGLNLFLASFAPITFYSVTNAVMSQEDYGRLRAESNGILVDGYEVYALIPGEGAVGGTEYIEYNTFLAAESTDLLGAQIMPTADVATLQAQYCPFFSPSQMGEFVAEAHFGGGNAQIAAAVARMDGYVPSGMPNVIYAVVRFLGHTQGGKDVETQEFSTAMNVGCGVLGGWTPCINDLCHAFCNQDATENKTCTPGLYMAGSSLPTCYDYINDAYTFDVRAQRESGAVDANNEPIMETVTEPICDACEGGHVILQLAN